MAKNKAEKYSEGAIRGKKVFLIGAMPVFIFLAFMAITAFVVSNFINKLSVNDNDDVCNTVRRQYASSIRAEWPCSVSDSGEYWTVSFDQSANSGAPTALMSFKYNKITKKVEPAISIN